MLVVSISVISINEVDAMVSYKITDGKLVSITPDVASHSLTIAITASQDGSLVITLPRALIDAKTGDQDDTFFVLVDGEEVYIAETKTSTDRTLTIQFPAGAEEIEIIGTTVNGDYYNTNTIPINNAFAVNPDTVYKDHVYSIKTYYYDLEKELKNGIESVQNALSSASFENSEAYNKIDDALDIRDKAWNGQIEDYLKQTEESLNYRDYKNAYDKLLQIDKSAYSLKDSLYATTKKIKDARDLEKKYQENKKTCILFWCSGDKDTYSVVNSKIQDLESKLKTIESKLSKIESEKNKINQSIHKYEIAGKNTEIKKLENLRKQDQYQAEQELRDQQYKDRLERQRLEEQSQKELQEQQYRADQERQRLEEQSQIDSEKNKIRLLAKQSPLIQGLINGGTLTFYFTPLPNYVSQNIRDMVNRLDAGLDGKTINGVTLKRSYSDNADFTINWVKDYQGEVIGRQVGNYLIVGLGSSNCGGEWKPFDAESIAKLTWHELGHALGQNHSNDVNNIMYPNMSTKYEYDYDETFNLSDGHLKQIDFCHSGSVYFSTEKLGSSDGYKVYVIGSNISPEDAINLKGAFYPKCSGYKNEFDSFQHDCNVEQGSSLVIYNPSVFGTGSDIPIHVKIINKNTGRNIDGSYDKNSRYYSQEYLDYVKTLFR